MSSVKYPYGKTKTVKVYDLATGAFIRFDKCNGYKSEKASEAELTIDADEIRQRVASERLNGLRTVERDYEGA